MNKIMDIVIFYLFKTWCVIVMLKLRLIQMRIKKDSRRDLNQGTMDL